LYESIESVEGEAGRDTVDPPILFALWMFATLESVSSARQLERLCDRDLAYMWICGEVGVNHHMLSDFRSQHGELLEQLLTDTIATLLHQGLVKLEIVAQDGVRVRAHAASDSFRQEKTLKDHQRKAREHIQKLREESENEQQRGEADARTQAAQQRAAREREERIEQALEELAKLKEQREKRKKGSGEGARASTTDPQARNMKMADGGFRPAYNVQFATDGDVRMIVGVDVTNSGSDRGQMASMHEKINKCYDKIPEKYMVDCGFATKHDITTVEKKGSQVFAPIHGEKKMREKGTDPHARQPNDTDEVHGFRQRMATEEAKELYKQRPSIAEFPNAECRNRGMTQFRVHGLEKVKAESLWYALTFNFMRMLNLGFI
jgi:transposase